MDVAVRELKAQLSAYLKRAAAGERITVTDRGRPIATLGPIPGKVDLTVAAADGWLRPATSSGLQPRPRVRSSRTVQEVLDEDREA